MYNGKKITKDDTWRPTDLIKHIQGQEDESRRRERSHRDPEREKRKHREEARDEREKESRREREREKYKDTERGRDGLRERVKEREKEMVSEREKRNMEKEKIKERDGEKDREREKRDREKEREKRGREKDGEREKNDREKERVKRSSEKDGEREKKDREREREKKDREREREKKDREKDRDSLMDKERDREREIKIRIEREQEKDRERERRRKEREHEKQKEKRVSLTVYDTSLERVKERKERPRERERQQGPGGEEPERNQRERDRREKHDHRQHTGHADGEERRERRRRETEQHSQLNHDEEIESERRHRRQDQHRKTLQEVKGEVLEEEREGGAEDHGSDDYEDDFEDYDEDFEEFDEEEDERRSAERDLSPRSRREVEDVQRAVERENELLSTTTRSPSSTQESEISLRASAESRKSRTYGRVIDFTAARQRDINQQAADKQKKRSTELQRLIDLDFSVTECFLDLPPVREYDLYIKSYGMANTKQAYVQSNEDNAERDAQTEETELNTKWTQHPPESSAACGGPHISQNASEEAVTGPTVDSKRLAAFLRSTTQVMAVLLEENVAESNSVKKIQPQTHTHSFSDGCVQLNTQLNLLQGRQVTLLHFSQTQSHTLLSVHALCSSSSDVTLDSETLICVWNIWEPSTPQRILIYEAEVRSCCFSPGKAALVFAGTDVGSVLVWDLREPSSSHTHIGVCDEEWTLRHPTFSTDAVLSGVGHFSSVVSVEPVLVNVGAGLRDPLLSEQEESLGLWFQLGSLDESGLLNLWVVVELPKADEFGSQTDLGLRPGGKVKLLHSSSLQTSPRVDKGVLEVTSPLSFVLKFLPTDSNHFFIGSHMGLVRHGTRHGLRAVPKLYRPKDGERPAEVTALDFCSTGEPFFLVGCSDGSVRLHTVECVEAVCEWTLGSGRGSVRCVRFSPTRCSVFCALDSASVLHIWDLTQRDDSPLVTQDLGADPVSAMNLFGDGAKKNPYSGMALAKRSGKLEIHFLLSSLTLPQASDADKLRSLTRDTL